MVEILKSELKGCKLEDRHSRANYEVHIAADLHRSAIKDVYRLRRVADTYWAKIARDLK